MEAIRRHPRDDSLTWNNQAFSVVRRWPAQGKRSLSAADKLAWGYLWDLARGGSLEISVTGTMVGCDGGTSGDAGTTRLKNLQAQGLIDVVDHSPTTGRWLLRMCDPLEVARAIRREGDPQRYFDFIDAYLDELAAEPFSTASDRPVAGQLSVASVASQPGPRDGAGQACGANATRDPARNEPRGVRGTSGASSDPPALPRPRSYSWRDNTQQESSIFHPSSTLSEDGIQDDRRPRRGTSGASSDPLTTLTRRVEQLRDAVEKPLPVTAGAVAKALTTRLPSIDEQARQATDLARKIAHRVNCERLEFSVALKVAWAIVEGRIRAAEVHNLLHHLDRVRNEDKLTCPASAYFISGAKRIFHRAGVDWRRTASPGGPA